MKVISFYDIQTVDKLAREMRLNAHQQIEKFISCGCQKAFINELSETKRRKRLNPIHQIKEIAK